MIRKTYTVVFATISLLGAISSLGVSSVALAQAKGGSETYQKQQVVDFGDDTIEGDLSKPDGDIFNGRKNAKHARLIRYRDNFRSEVLQSIRAL
jgi:hypothetical protein